MDSCIKALQIGNLDDILTKLEEFNSQNGQIFHVKEPLTKKKSFVELLFRFLRDPTYSEVHGLCLSTLRIITRDKNNLDELFPPDRLQTLLHLARLVGEEEAFMTDESKEFDTHIVVEAQKCLCNLIFNSQIAQRICCNNSCIDGVMLRLRMYKDPQLPSIVKYFDMRMLFLLSALCADIRPRIRDEYHGLIYLMEAVDLILKDDDPKGNRKSIRKRKGSNRGKTVKDKPQQIEEEPINALDDSSVDLACEVLKVLFNLTCNLDRNNLDEIEEAHFLRLVGILHDLLLCETKNKDKRNELQNHTVNLLTNMPPSSYEELLVSVEEAGKLDNPMFEFEDMNAEAIYVLIEFLERRLEKPRKSMHESLAPILTCLSEISRSNRIIRKYLRLQVLPPLKDVMNRPEEGKTLRNRLVKLMTNPNTDVKELVADFLFVLCKENVGRLIKYTGYGNAAGLLANRGLMLGGRGKDNYSSESEDSDTEEYIQFKDKINPVVGCYEEPKPNPMEGMTEEQKEYEAMQLVNMMDKLSRTGVVLPCKISFDGKAHPIDHVLELQNNVADDYSESDS